jgi:hypothetical protein
MDHSPHLIEQAIKRIDEENSKDPNQVVVDGSHTYPRELAYSKRLTDWVKRLQPSPSELLLIAARCQHLCRWMIPRHTYEMNRSGYLQWRSDLKKLHAQKAGEILSEIGYSQDFVTRVQALNLKKNLKDSDTQTLEDEDQFTEFASRTDREKMIGILQKTWAKMSEQGRAEALKLTLSDPARKLLQEALA